MSSRTVYQKDPRNLLTLYRLPSQSGCSVLESDLAEGGRLPLHRHDEELEIMQIVSGERVLTVKGRRKLVRAGDLEVIPAGTEHGMIDPLPQSGRLPPTRLRSILVSMQTGTPAVPEIDLEVHRIVAVRRDRRGRITAVGYEDGRVRDIEDAVRDADRGLIQGVHVVRPRDGEARLRVHHSMKRILDLNRLPLLP